MRKILTSLIAAGVLVGAGVSYALLSPPVVASAQGDEDTATTVVEDPDTESETDDTTGGTTDERRGPHRGFGPFGGGLVDDVLDDLVADGTITQAQADAISEAMEARRDELKSQRGEGFPGRGFGHRGGPGGFGGPGLGSLLDDGVIESDELAELPEDHPLLDADGPAAPYLEDGELTMDELEELHETWRKRRDGTESDTDTATEEDTEEG